MLIAQITDLHIGAEPGNPREPNVVRLAAVLSALCALRPCPNLLLATGDLADLGMVEAYRTLRAMFDALPFPVWPSVGNHDRRDNFRTVFPEVPVAGGRVQHVVDASPLRLVVLDTLDEGRHGGAFDADAAAWLEAQLCAAPFAPAIVVLHHPPFATGSDWMTADPDAPWIVRLAAVVRRHPQVVRVVCGHIHRPMLAMFAGVPAAVCASTAPLLALDLSPVPAVPDGRPLVVDEPPGFALHYWTGTSLVTHFGVASDPRTLAHYDARMAPVVAAIVGEPPGS